MATTLSSTVRADRTDLALTIVRVAIGVIFVAHGAQKMFTMGFGGVTGMFTQVGIPLPAVTAPLVILVELFGGIALIIGLLTRLAALGLAIDMLGAISFVHLKNGFFLPTGYEFALLLFVGCVALALGGAGPYSVDATIAGRRRVA